ncbi:Methyltransferase domain-containing protein [Micromonospora pallida]|uniref:Methyltransferase domain-containing protein n=1 Tax=Micromonospora pallida TaxID=145854 RepID=A0A1C6SNW3_9ACTN|nr:class I SAM-dependent methyltransferase [Micromonospora pallida]SCL30925.1 Methyltransferase domain-containing protein [Micromonospora pallida]
MLSLSDIRTDWKIFRQTMRDSTLKEALVDSFEYIKIRFHEQRERFDERYGTETNGIVGLADIDGIGPHLEEASHYLPTRKQEFDRMMATVGEIDHREHVFVDLGCGKGRVVLLAAEKPYKRVVGVDFSPTFIAQAKENVERYTGPVATNEIELLAIDAVDFVVPPENLVVFLFSPFGPPVFDTVMRNLVASTRQRKQKITIVYYSPDYDDVVRAAGFTLVGQGKGDHWPWSIYSVGGE